MITYLDKTFSLFSNNLQLFNNHSTSMISLIIGKMIKAIDYFYCFTLNEISINQHLVLLLLF